MLFASTIYFVEYWANPEKAAFESIPHAVWFMLVTMTTVGYGDVSPNTSAGKVGTEFNHQTSSTKDNQRRHSLSREYLGSTLHSACYTG